MLILGIESSCDETAASVVEATGTVLSNEISSQIPLHARYGGVIPEIASRNHLLAIDSVVGAALSRAQVTLADLGLIAVTQGPGLLGSLMVGVQYAKALSTALRLPLCPVHHVEGHITAIQLQDGGEHPHGPLEGPYVALAVSGGHTSVYHVERPGKYQLLGYTVDDAAGEAFDKVARILGLPYPGGVEIDRLSKQGRPDAVAFPRPMSTKGNLQFSFSGLKTAARLFLEQHTDLAGEGLTLADVAASFQEAVVDVLLNKTFQAAQSVGVRDVVIAGGVAANSRLRAKMAQTAPEARLRAHLTHLRYCTDNAAMIAGTARFIPPLSPATAASLEPFASGQLPSRI